MKLMMSLLRDDQGQDLIEYSLLLAFVLLASSASFLTVGGSVSGIWTVANGYLGHADASLQAAH